VGVQLNADRLLKRLTPPSESECHFDASGVLSPEWFPAFIGKVPQSIWLLNNQLPTVFSGSEGCICPTSDLSQLKAFFQ
jgi:hypothetical protein